MPKSDPHFSHLCQNAGAQVFERLHGALNEMAIYIPTCRQNPFWKAHVVNGIWKAGTLVIVRMAISDLRLLPYRLAVIPRVRVFSLGAVGEYGGARVQECL